MSIPFDIHQLRCFIAVAEELHFGRAARRMHLTQPPLSRQIKLLETRLGVRLIERGDGAVTLTAGGLAFLRGAREVISAAQTSTALARQAAAEYPECLSIGFTPVAAYEALPNLLRHIRKEFPSVTLQLNELMTLPQLSALVRKDIDVALLRPSVSLQQFEKVLVSADELVAALPANHHLAQKSVLSLSDFENEPFIGHDPVRARYLSEITTQAFRTAGVAPRFIQTLTEPQTMLTMVRAGLGVAVLAGQVGRYTQDPRIVFRRLEQDTFPPEEIWLVWRKGHYSAVIDGLALIAKHLMNVQPRHAAD